jgi:hypothetical protein
MAPSVAMYQALPALIPIALPLSGPTRFPFQVGGGQLQQTGTNAEEA